MLPFFNRSLMWHTGFQHFLNVFINEKIKCETLILLTECRPVLIKVKIMDKNKKTFFIVIAFF